MVDEELLLVEEAVAVLRLHGPHNFARFARRHGLPVVRFGGRVRVRRADLDSFIQGCICEPTGAVRESPRFADTDTTSVHVMNNIECEQENRRGAK